MWFRVLVDVLLRRTRPLNCGGGTLNPAGQGMDEETQGTSTIGVEKGVSAIGLICKLRVQ